MGIGVEVVVGSVVIESVWMKEMGDGRGRWVVIMGIEGEIVIGD